IARDGLHRHAAPDFRRSRLSLERCRDQRKRRFRIWLHQRQRGRGGMGGVGLRSSIFSHMLENGHEELPVDLTNGGGAPNFKFMGELAEKGHKHVVAYVHRFGEAGTMGQMDCVYSYWGTRRDEGFGAQGLAAWRVLVRVRGLAIKTAAQADIPKTLGRVYLGRDAAEQV